MRILTALLICAVCLGGCSQYEGGPRAIFLDGAGWYSGDGPVRQGLREAGFAGKIERFGWSSMLGPLTDHVAAGTSHPKAQHLSQHLTRLRQAGKDDKLVLIGLSAGTSIVVSALEKLPAGVSVDHVVLLSPSVSSTRDLTKALRHVKHRLYVTSSPHDSLLACSASAGLESGRPAGQVGFETPKDATDETRELYRKVVRLPWRPGYAAYGWDGGHVSVTSAQFIRVVIAPRILEDRPHPLDMQLEG